MAFATLKGSETYEVELESCPIGTQRNLEASQKKKSSLHPYESLLWNERNGDVLPNVSFMEMKVMTRQNLECEEVT